jgi:hypothetical protein
MRILFDSLGQVSPVTAVFLIAALFTGIVIGIGGAALF